ncbi:MAG: YdcF family protein [Limisphaerales bacterium]
MSSDSGSRVRRSLRVALGLTLAALLLSVAGLYFSESILCVDSGTGKGEALVVLGGEKNYRPSRALELFRAGSRSCILITGTGDWNDVRLYLEGNGVPPAAIQLEKESRNTKQNAEFAVKLLRERHVTRAVIVTSWFHSRRALNCFRHYAPEIDFTASPTVLDRPKGHWPDKYERVWVLSEYIKLLGYWVCYGIRPF